MFVKFNGRYVGPFMKPDATGDTGGANNSENNSQNGTETISKAEHDKVIRELEAKHAREYSGLQTTLNKKDELLKNTTTALEERTTQYTSLTGTHTEVSGKLETVEKTAAEKDAENKRLKLENARSKLISKEFPNLASFEYPDGEGAISLIPQIEPWKEDGSLDEGKLRQHFFNFSKALGDRAQSQKRVDKQGEVPDEPTPEKELTGSKALRAKANAFFKEGKFVEYNQTMDLVYKAEEKENKK